MSGLCAYQNIFGQPNQGFHSTRICGLAFFDLLGTFLLAFLLAKYTKLHFLPVLIMVFVLAQVIHYVFCVPTAFQRFLFG